MANYEDKDPSLTDDLLETEDGIKSATDKVKRAKDAIDKGRDYLRKSGNKKSSSPDAPSAESPSQGGSINPGVDPASGQPAQAGGGAASATPAGAEGVAGAGEAGGAGAAAGGTSSGAAAGGGAAATAGGGTAAGASAGAGGTVAGSAAAGGVAAAGGAAASGAAASGGSAAAAGAAAAGGSAGVVIAVVAVVVIIIIAMVSLLPNATGGNSITHYNDGEVFGAQGPNSNDEYDWGDLDYGMDEEDEEKEYLRQAKKAQKELAAYYYTYGLLPAVEEAKEKAKTLDYDDNEITKINIKYDGFRASSKEKYILDHVFKDTDHMNTSTLYLLCAYSAYAQNYLGKDESIKSGYVDVEDEDGDIVEIFDLYQRHPEDSVFNSADEMTASGDLKGAVAIIRNAFDDVDDGHAGTGLGSLYAPNYDYGNIIHGVEIGEPYKVVTGKTIVEDGVVSATYEIDYVVDITVHDVGEREVEKMAEELFDFKMEDVYEARNSPSGSEEVYSVTMREVIDDMVTYSGQLILQASGEDVGTISFSYGSAAMGGGYYATGSGGIDIVNAALSLEGTVDASKIQDYCGISHSAGWCAAFVSYCANECGLVDSGVVPKTAGPAVMRDWYKNKGLYKEASSGYTPKAGDIVFFSTSYYHTSECGHVGIVVSANADGSVTTIEGNTDDPSGSGMFGVYKKTRYTDRGYTKIVGYATPEYPSTPIYTGGKYYPPVRGLEWRSYVSSWFGVRPEVFGRGGTENHGAIDIKCGTGTEVHAAASGTVYFAGDGRSGRSWTYGNYVEIDHGDGTHTLYAHNSQLLVRKGDVVQTGQVIALSGSTGRSTGPHCHFERRENNGNKRVDPVPYLP